MEIDYENPWRYRGKPFTSDRIHDSYGFVYCITEKTTGRQYVGRKYFWSKRKPRGKSRRVTKESDWKSYYGSNDELKKAVKKNGIYNYDRKILSLHKTVGKTNFAETEALFKHKVLTEKMKDGTPKYFNNQILNRYFKKDYWED